MDKQVTSTPLPQYHEMGGVLVTCFYITDHLLTGNPAINVDMVNKTLEVGGIDCDTCVLVHLCTDTCALVQLCIDICAWMQ